MVKNLEVKRERDAARRKKTEETNRLRSALKKAIESKGYDIAKMFKLFDTNGDGTFDQKEFEAAFTVLEIDFKVSELRTLIDLSDKNHDGKIDFSEFHAMLYSPAEEVNDQFEVISENSDDE